MWQAAPEFQQEPVAYLVTIQRFDRLDARLVYKLDELVLNASTKLVSYELLYTHPQPKREPLSQDDLISIWNSSTKLIPYEHFQAIFRFSEKTHGIGFDK
jgi:hypothetical protein